MKVYECIVDDGYDVFKSQVVAKNTEELLSVYGGNGKFIQITDVTKDCLVDEYKLYDDLRNIGYSQVEASLLVVLLSEHNKTLNSK